MTSDAYEAWLMSRLGKVTASRVADVIGKTKSGWSAYRRKYLIELMAERLTGMPAKQFLSDAMLHGQLTEPDARRAYERATGNAVEQVWFIPHPTIPMSGASPDGYVGKDGLLEIKCPESATHLTFLLDQKINPDHVTQMQWQMASTSRKWCDYASYDPRLPAELRLKIVRVERDNALIADLEKMVTEFLGELDEALKSLGPFEPLTPNVSHLVDADYGGKITMTPMNMERQIRPEDEEHWKPSQLVGRSKA